MWQKTRALIRKYRSFLITTHVFPDGDAVGSELALAALLRKLGKRALVVNEHPVPKIYAFLDPRRTAKTCTKKLRPRMAKCDAAFVVDVSSLERAGRVGAWIDEAGLPTACIDHHKTNAHFADVNVVDPGAASTGEMIYDLATRLRVPITRPIADRLFVAIATDTGWFRFPNTTPGTLRVAAELMEAGARTDRLYGAVHETLRWQRMALMRDVLGTLRSECGGQIAHFYATESMLRRVGATYEDTEGFTDLPRVLHNVKLIFFFRQIGRTVKVSIRSKDGPSVEGLARKHGGGGHAKAAGVVMAGPLRKAMKTLLADARKLLKP